jgi:hypothetical protein
MGRVRKMPTREKIFEYWADKLDLQGDDNTCFKCSFTSGAGVAVDRAHILSVFDGGSDDVSNLHLLCGNCHLESEIWFGDAYFYWLKSNSDRNTTWIDIAKEYYKGNIKNIYPELIESFNLGRDSYIAKHGQETFDKQLV